MTAKEILPHLQRWEQIQREAEAVWNKLEAVTGYTDSESPLGRAVWGTFDAYTRTLADLIGDRAEWLEWYHLENQMGARGHEASARPGQKPRPIRNIQDLAKLIACK